MNWRRRELIPYTAVVGMELSWLYALISIMGRISEWSLSPFYLYPVYFLALGFGLLVNRLKWWRGPARLLSILPCLVATQLTLKVLLFRGVGFNNPAWLYAIPRALPFLPGTFKPELVVFTGSLILWWLGTRLARSKVDFSLSVSEFQFGLIIMLVLFFVISQLNQEAGYGVPVAISFVAFALMGISVSHAESGTSWLRSRMRSYWLTVLVITIIVVIVLGLALAFFVTPDVLRAAFAPVRWVWAQVCFVGRAIGNWMVEHLTMKEIPLPTDMVAEPVPPSSQEELPIWEYFGWSIRLRDILRFIMMIFFILVFSLTIWRLSSLFLNMLRSRMTVTAGADVEHLDGAFEEDVLNFFKRIWLRLLEFLHLRRPASSSAITLSGIPEIDAVRGTYRDLTRWAGARGLPRFSFQTPFEYLYALEDAIPEAQQDLRFITSQYIGSRYGLVIPGEGELSKLKNSWQRVKHSPVKKESARLTKAKKASLKDGLNKTTGDNA